MKPDEPKDLGLMEAPAPLTLAKEETPVKAESPAQEEICHRVSFTAPDDVVKKLDRLKELMGDATYAEVIGKAAELLLEKVDPIRRDKRRQARAQAKAEAKANANVDDRAKANAAPKANASAIKAKVMPRRPPIALRDRVLAAAATQCEFVAKDGVRCTETRFLSIDHIRPFALGGTSTDQRNLRCLCQAHNLFLARRSFGAAACQPRPRGI